MLILSFDYPPNHGGISRLCGEIARRFRERGVLRGVLTQTAAEPTPAVYPDGTRVPVSRPRRELAAFARVRIFPRRRGRGACSVVGILPLPAERIDLGHRQPGESLEGRRRTAEVPVRDPRPRSALEDSYRYSSVPQLRYYLEGGLLTRRLEIAADLGRANDMLCSGQFVNRSESERDRVIEVARAGIEIGLSMAGVS